jgi:hypothetical protein
MGAYLLAAHNKATTLLVESDLSPRNQSNAVKIFVVRAKNSFPFITKRDLKSLDFGHSSFQISLQIFDFTYPPANEVNVPLNDC